MKFVILSEKGKNYQVYFHEALKRSDVLYSDYYLSDTTLFDKFLQKLHGTKKIPMGIKKMFHFLWTIRFHLLKLNKFIKNEDCIILVYRSWYALFEEGLDKYLKNINSKCKLVWVFGDIVSSYKVELSNITKKFDKILTFDFEDADKYGFTYYPEIYSDIDLDDDNSIPKTTVLFLGAAKNRMSIIAKTFKKLNDNGIKADFYIAAAKDEDKVYSENIHYINFMDYYDYLRHVKKSECLIEFLQDINNHGWTTRTSEAIFFGKKLLSNNVKLKEAPFYNPDYISIFENPDDINIDFLVKKVNNIDYNFKDKLKFEKFAEFLKQECL